MNEENLVIHKIFSAVSSKSQEKIALQIKRENLWQSFSYKEVELYSLRVGALLIKEGFKKSEFAAIILENRPEWAIIYLGIMHAGLTSVPLDSQLSPQEIRDLIIDSGVRIIFCSHSLFINKIKEVIQDIAIKVVVLDIEDKNDKNCINFSDIDHISLDNIVWPTVLPEDIASLIYTSGTTAKPKGVLLSHKNICSNFKSIAGLNIYLPSDNTLCILPLYHTYAFMVTLIMPLFKGAMVTYFALSFKPQDLSLIIKEAQVTMLVGVPQLFFLLHKAIFDKIKKFPSFLLPFLLPFIRQKLAKQFGRSLRLLVSGGARLEPKIGKDLSRLLGIRLIEGYGLTETSPVVTLNPPHKIKFGSVGKVIPGVQIKIFNPDKFGIGEVLIKGPNVMLGYFKQPDLTNQVIKDGWFYSGDLGFIDSRGYLFLTGREKDVIVLSSGKNIYPEEVEEYYGRSPYIKELCILSRRQERAGRIIESLFAVVVPNLEYFRQKNETDIQAKIRWELENLSRNLPGYKHIMGFLVTKDALPRTALRKIKRYEVQEKYVKLELVGVEAKEPVFLEEDTKLLKNDVARKIISYLSKELNKPVYLDSHLEIDLGIDSLTKVELGLGLEALFSIKIPDEFFYTTSTVKEIVKNVLDIIDRPESVIGAPQDVPISWSEILKKKPKEIVTEKIRTDSVFLDKLPTFIFKIIFLFILRLFWLLRIEGKSLLPKQGPYLLCPNHASYLDGFVVFSSLPFGIAKNAYFLGYSKILEHPLIGWANKVARLIPIDPSQNLTDAMQAVSFVLSHKKIVCLFPEGRRSVDENMGEFKKGVGILIKELNIPVVPIYIKGSHYSWPRTKHLPRLYPLKIIFGKPVRWQELIKKHIGEFTDDYAATAQGLRQEVVKLKCQNI